jgi:hypothetical protein
MWGRKVTAVLCNDAARDQTLGCPGRTFSGIWEICGRAVYLQLVLYNNQLYYDALLKHDHESTRAGVDWEGRGSIRLFHET